MSNTGTNLKVKSIEHLTNMIISEALMSSFGDDEDDETVFLKYFLVVKYSTATSIIKRLFYPLAQ